MASFGPSARQFPRPSVCQTKFEEKLRFRSHAASSASISPRDPMGIMCEVSQVDGGLDIKATGYVKGGADAQTLLKKPRAEMLEKAPSGDAFRISLTLVDLWWSTSSPRLPSESCLTILEALPHSDGCLGYHGIIDLSGNDLDDIFAEQLGRLLRDTPLERLAWERERERDSKGEREREGER